MWLVQLFLMYVDSQLCFVFEIFSLIKLQAKGLISEYQPKYNSARAVYRERKKYIDEIDWNMLAIPPSGSSKAIPSVSFIVLHLKAGQLDYTFQYPVLGACITTSCM